MSLHIGLGIKIRLSGSTETVCVASWPHTLCERPVCPPCGHSSPAWGSYPALHSGTSAPSCSHACSRTDCSGNGAAILSCPVRRREAIHYLLLVPVNPLSSAHFPMDLTTSVKADIFLHSSHSWSIYQHHIKSTMAENSVSGVSRRSSELTRRLLYCFLTSLYSSWDTEEAI